ncbi:hypothetical protein DL96DRAFT_789651 [Flagelloscypha sp. PMI_526]|nr:hypothetical protein DL96DRAFT_789651 [Flagelloscypha sp. PMI_526]
MDAVRFGMEKLRMEANTNLLRSEEAESKVKMLEQVAAQLQNRLAVLGDELNEAKSNIHMAETEMKMADENRTPVKHSGTVQKILLLERELDQVKRNLKESTEKLVQADIRVAHLDITVARLVQETNIWEKKCEVMTTGPDQPGFKRTIDSSLLGHH